MTRTTIFKRWISNKWTHGNTNENTLSTNNLLRTHSDLFSSSRGVQYHSHHPPPSSTIPSSINRPKLYYMLLQTVFTRDTWRRLIIGPRGLIFARVTPRLLLLLRDRGHLSAPLVDYLARTRAVKRVDLFPLTHHQNLPRSALRARQTLLLPIERPSPHYWRRWRAARRWRKIIRSASLWLSGREDLIAKRQGDQTDW